MWCRNIYNTVVLGRFRIRIRASLVLVLCEFGRLRLRFALLLRFRSGSQDFFFFEGVAFPSCYYRAGETISQDVYGGSCHV
jgi:hypothetical protein